MFSPYQGRFITLDPIRFDGGTTNLYQAEFNNPVNQLDPSGLQPLPSSKGEFIVDQGSFVIDMTESFGGVSGSISFKPSMDRCRKCTNIRLIQSVRLVKGNGQDHKWNDDRDNYQTVGNDAQGVSPKWMIDVLPKESNCKPGKPCSPYYRDHMPNESADGFLFGELTVPASLHDSPQGRPGDKFSFETVAVCADNGQQLGSLKWGFEIDQTTRRVVFVNPEAGNKPSVTFQAALMTFNKYYNNK